MEDTVMTTASKLSRRTVLLGAGVSVATTGPFFHVTPAKADKGELVVVGWGGSRAAAMRYFLGIEAYFSAMAAPPAQQQEKRLHDWFALTEQHPRQLHELERDEYLAIKRRELATP